jgi:type II secretory pathway pseudopilin PulG
MAALLGVAIIGVWLAAVSIVWEQDNRREREAELLFIGNQFRQAIALYYHRTPGVAKQYPASLDDLIKDSRYLSTQRYLRKVFIDPFTGKAEWGVVQAPSGGIMGIYSLAEGAPIKQDGFRDSEHAFANAQRYRDWQFVFQPSLPIAANTSQGKSSLPPITR